MPHHSWVVPTPGGDQDTWGTIINQALTGATASVDADLYTLEQTVNATATGCVAVAAAALPRAGGVMTGRVDEFSATTKQTDLGTGGTGSVALDLATANVFKYRPTGTTTFTVSNYPTVAGSVVVMIVRVDRPAALPLWSIGTIRWPLGTAPTLFSTDGIDTYVFLSDDSTPTWDGWLAARQLK